MESTRSCLFALCALTFCDVVSAQVGISTPAPVCNTPEIAACNQTAHLVVDYGYQGQTSADAKCRAVAAFEKCIEKFSIACSATQRTVWVGEQTRLQEKLNLQMGADCSSVRLDGSAVPQEASSGDSGSTSWGSSGSNKVSGGSYYWQWLIVLLCLTTCCVGAIAGIVAYSMMGSKKRGRRTRDREPEDDEEDDEEKGYNDEEELTPLPATSQAIPIASPSMAYTGNALATGSLQDEANFQSNPTASMTLTDPNYVPNMRYAP